VNERIFFHHSDGVIRVCEIALHSDGSYERLLSQGVWTKDYTDFVPWTAG
jgi:hypothetical protein